MGFFKTHEPGIKNKKHNFFAAWKHLETTSKDGHMEISCMFQTLNPVFFWYVHVALTAFICCLIAWCHMIRPLMHSSMLSAPVKSSYQSCKPESYVYTWCLSWFHLWFLYSSLSIHWHIYLHWSHKNQPFMDRQTYRLPDMVVYIYASSKFFPASKWGQKSCSKWAGSKAPINGRT